MKSTLANNFCKNLSASERNALRVLLLPGNRAELLRALGMPARPTAATGREIAKAVAAEPGVIIGPEQYLDAAAATASL